MTASVPHGAVSVDVGIGNTRMGLFSSCGAYAGNTAVKAGVGGIAAAHHAGASVDTIIRASS